MAIGIEAAASALGSAIEGSEELPSLGDGSAGDVIAGATQRMLGQAGAGEKVPATKRGGGTEAPPDAEAGAEDG